jgi:glycosyltransferase involved in cell wall biosynthesis
MVTGHYDVGGLDLGRGLIRRQRIEGMDVVAVGIRYSNRQSFLRRIGSFLCFVVLGTYVGLRTGGVDAVYATSTPLTVGIGAMILKCVKRIPFVFEVRDQWPEIPIEMGIIRNTFLIRILLWLERTIYRHSTAVVALSPGMADGVRSVLNEKKTVVVIPNCSDTGVFHPGIDGSAVRRERGWGDKLVLLHFGAMGRANGLGFVLDVAERIKGNSDIHFVLMGDGKERSALMERAERSGSKNVEILSSVAKEALPPVIAACDVVMVIFARYGILEHNSANKFFDSLSAGKPILLNYGGWQRKILENNEAGFGCDLYDLDEFVERVLYLHSHQEHLRKMGKNARRIAEEEFDRDKLARRTLEVIVASIDSQPDRNQ